MEFYPTESADEKFMSCPQSREIPSRKHLIFTPPCQNPKTPQIRLTNAQNLGSIEAKKIIQLFEKKRGETGTNYSLNIIPRPSCKTESRPTNRSFDEELYEEVLAIKNYDVDLTPNSKRVHNESSVQTSEQAKKDQSVSIYANANNKVKMAKLQKETHIIDKEKQHATKDFCIQHSSIFSNENSSLFGKRSVEIQYDDAILRINDNLTKRPKSSKECNLNDKPFKTYDPEDKEERKIPSELDNNLIKTTLEKNEKLKKIIKLLILNQREQKLKFNYNKYISDVKSKYYNPDDDRLKRLKNENKLLYPSTSARRIRSNFVSRGFKDNRPKSGFSRSHDKTTISSELDEYERQEIDLSSLYHSTDHSYDLPKSTHMANHSSLVDYNNKRRMNPFCYPMVTNMMDRFDESRYLRRGYKRVYSISNTDINSIPEKFYPRENVVDVNKTTYDYSEMSCEYASKPRRKKKFVLPERSTTPQYHTNALHEVLSPVTEECSINMQPKEQSKKKQTIFSKSSFNNGEPSIHNDYKLGRYRKRTEIDQNINANKSSLNSIENKLDILIDSIHTLMNEMKTSKNHPNNMSSLAPFAKDDSNFRINFKGNTKINKTQSDPQGISIGDKILQSVGKIILENSKIDIKRSHEKSCEIKVIISTEMHAKSTNTLSIEPVHEEPIMTDITATKCTENSEKHRVICNEFPKALQLTVDFLVNDSSQSHKIKDVTNANLNYPDEKRPGIKTIATQYKPVEKHGSHNIEWISQLISKQNIMKLLSFVPIVNQYLYFLQDSQPIPYQNKFTCNFCGKSYQHSSELSSHITSHSTGCMRECAICRQALSKQGDSIKAIMPIPKLFTCQYCGKQFTRAYCLQLHEQSCNEQRRKDGGSIVLLS